jgi:hypothetical protein
MNQKVLDLNGTYPILHADSDDLLGEDIITAKSLNSSLVRKSLRKLRAEKTNRPCEFMSRAKNAGQNLKVKMGNRFLENVSKVNPGDCALEGVSWLSLSCWV